MTSPLSYKMKGIDGKEVDLASTRARSSCSSTSPAIAATRRNTPVWKSSTRPTAKEGLVIIGVPANEFGKQEPGTDEEIAKFCDSKYHVTFPMLSKVVVKGEGIARSMST